MYKNEGTSTTETGLSREAPLTGSDYAELQEDQMQNRPAVHARQNVEMATYLELISSGQHSEIYTQLE